MDEFYDNQMILIKACYTGYLLYAEELIKSLKINDKITEKILKTHEKINYLIESFNKNTDYKFKKIFEDRNNYCDSKKCYSCKVSGTTSCINYEIYKNSNMNEFEYDIYCKLIKNTINELIEFTNQKLT